MNHRCRFRIAYVKGICMWGGMGLLAAAGWQLGGCSTLADDCLEGRCWEAGGGGDHGGGGQGGATSSGGGDGGGSGGSPPTPQCGDGVFVPGEVCFTQPFVSVDLQGNYALDMVVTDCDQDGDEDLIVADESTGDLTVLINDPPGTLTAAPPWPSGLHEVRLTRAEADGNLEDDELYLAGVSVGSGPGILLYEVSSDCTITHVRTFLGCRTPADVAAVRFAGDQLDDAVAISASSNPPQGMLDVVADGSAAGSCSGTPLGTDYPAGMVAAPLDGDGLLDIAFVDDQADSLFVRLNTGTDFGAATETPLPGAPVAVAAGDLDGDTTHDLAAVTNAGSYVRLYTNDGSGDVTQVPPDLPIQPSASVPASAPVEVQLVDIDLDGDLDVITANFCDPSQQEGSVSLFLQTEDGQFAPATSAQFGSAVGQDFPVEVARHPASVRVVDLNGDLVPDIVTTAGYADGGGSQVSVLLANP